MQLNHLAASVPIYSFLRRSALVAMLFCELGIAGELQFVAAQVGQQEQLKEMPKSGEDSEGTSAEQLPFPQSEPVPPDEPYWFRPPTRINRYDVWQFYEVDRYGQFRPRVIYSPYGSFYLYDGRPFPWISTHQLNITPRVVGP